MKSLTHAHHPNHGRPAGPDRRCAPDRRVGRRQTDAWFPYSTAFVAQAMAQAAPHEQAQAIFKRSAYDDEQESHPSLAITA